MSSLESLWRNIDAAAIGASAGGVEVLLGLRPRLPAACRASLFVVVHIPREGPSLLPELFVDRCAVRVKEAEDKEPVQPGSVYFAPPDYHLLIERALPEDRGPCGGGPTLALSNDEPVHFSRPSIDVLFESAADVYGERLMGLILTGASDDGVAGLAAVRRARGRTFVQDPRTAAVPMLPEAALDGGSVDLLMTLEQLQVLFASCPVST